jgi:hypothetical protein
VHTRFRHWHMRGSVEGARKVLFMLAPGPRSELAGAAEEALDRLRDLRLVVVVAAAREGKLSTSQRPCASVCVWQPPPFNADMREALGDTPSRWRVYDREQGHCAVGCRCAAVACWCLRRRDRRGGAHPHSVGVRWTLCTWSLRNDGPGMSHNYVGYIIYVRVVPAWSRGGRRTAG